MTAKPPEEPPPERPAAPGIRLAKLLMVATPFALLGLFLLVEILLRR